MSRSLPRLPEIAYRKHVLPNGLDVILRRDDRLPLVSSNLWYHVGSKDERDGQRGFAHLFEHLMFEGSLHYPGDFFGPLQRLGARINGSTSPDRTNYFVDLPSDHLELVLGMEADRMGHLLPALDERKLEVQKGVVTNEYRQNYANRPYGMVPRLLAEALYPPDHPYRWPTIGAMEDVASASVSHVDAFFRRFYTPSNASLCLVGDFELDETLGLVERSFGPIPGGSPALRPIVPTLVSLPDAPLVLRDRVELERLYLLWPSVPQFQLDDAPLTLAADLLARGRSSRLYRRLVLRDEVAQDISAYQGGRELAGSFGVVVTLRPGESRDRARSIVLDELRALPGSIEPGELDRVRVGRLGALIYSLDEIGGFGGVADRLNAFNVYLGDPGRITSDLQRFEAVDPEAIAERVGTYLIDQGGIPKPHVELFVARDRPSTAATIPTAVPAVGSRRQGRFQVPVPDRIVLRCGLEVWAIPRRDLPIVASSLAIPAGASSHGPSQGGLASITSAMLDEGTESRDLEELARRAESMATTLRPSAGWDGSYLGMRCLSSMLDESLELAVDLVRAPAFPDREWHRVRGQTLDALRSGRTKPESLAHRALIRALYGAGHPYRVPVDGTIGTLEAIDRDDLRAFHRLRYRPEGSALVIAGDFEPDRLADRLDRLFEGWEGRVEPSDPPPRPAEHDGRRIIVVHRADSNQAMIRVGHVGLARGDDDYHDALVLNQILGGQFSSRLNEVLRERKGLTYGVRSHFDARHAAGPFTVSAAVQSDRVAEAVLDVANAIQGLLGEHPATAKELDDARRGIIEGLARQFETPSDLVSRFASLFIHGLPRDEYSRLEGRLGRVDLDSLAAVGARHLRPDSLLAVVVADADQVIGPLQDLGWSAVERVEPETLDVADV